MIIHTVEYNEIVSDLVNFMVGQSDNHSNTLLDVMRYGCDGLLNRSNKELMEFALKAKIYGEDVVEIIIK